MAVLLVTAHVVAYLCLLTPWAAPHLPDWLLPDGTAAHQLSVRVFWLRQVGAGARGARFGGAGFGMRDPPCFAF